MQDDVARDNWEREQRFALMQTIPPRGSWRDTQSSDELKSRTVSEKAAYREGVKDGKMYAVRDGLTRSDVGLPTAASPQATLAEKQRDAAYAALDAVVTFSKELRELGCEVEAADELERLLLKHGVHPRDSSEPSVFEYIDYVQKALAQGVRPHTLDGYREACRIWGLRQKGGNV